MMTRTQFSVQIQAAAGKVWQVLWNHDSYRSWTSIFAEGSYAETDGWKTGTKVLFLSPQGSGMVSMVAENRENEYMSFTHIGMVQNGVEDTTSEAVQAWAGAMENYTLQEADGATLLTVEMDITGEYREYFTNTWPKALEKVKELAEALQ